MANQYTNDPRQVACLCKHCGISFSTYRAFVAVSGRPFCSLACKHAARQVSKRCVRCHKKFTIPLSHNGKNGRGKYCSRACLCTPSNIKRLQKTAAVQRYRARKRAALGTATASEIAGRIAMWGGRCYMCGVIATTIDHVIPLIRGGTNWPANLRPACLSCNLGKSIRPMPSNFKIIRHDWR